MMSRTFSDILKDADCCEYHSWLKFFWGELMERKYDFPFIYILFAEEHFLILENKIDLIECKRFGLRHSPH